MKLKELRKQAKLTQKELANTLNLSQPTYQNYESEYTQPPIDLLIKLADYFNVSMDYLVGRNYRNDLGYLTQEQKTLVQMIQELNEINLIKATSYIAGLVAGQ